MISSRFYSINGCKIHYLSAGQGAPIVLFHPSPSSSKSLIPLIKQLAPHFTVIAVDTPGYGESDPLLEKPKELKDYCQYFNSFFKEIGLDQFALYGSATGGQLGIRYALEFPEQVHHLYLDNVVDFKDEERNEILKNYFPDISPKYDGRHLMTIWTMVHDLFMFFPWYASSPENRLKVPFPPAVFLHQFALEYMVAGDNYDWAYRLAFEHERIDYIRELKRPTSIFNWQGSILKSRIEWLVAQDLPMNVNSVIIPPDRNERYSKMVEHIKKTYVNSSPNKYQLPDIDLKQENIKKQNEIEKILADLPKLIPDENGVYLINAWHHLRDQQLYKNPKDKSVENIITDSFNLKARYLQELLIAWMKKG